jgi:2'-5' RNA ligase
MTSRLFVAVIPPLDVIEHLEEFTEPRVAHNNAARRQRSVGSPDELPLRWTGSEQWHLTLAFMPGVADDRLDELFERLTTAAAKRRPFTLQLQGAGVFGDPLAAKGLYIGVSGETDELHRLSAGARNAAVISGVEVDGATLHPHLTLARLNRRTDLGSWLQVFDTYAGPTWTVNEIELIESRLGQGANGRPRYQSVQTFGLS